MDQQSVRSKMSTEELEDALAEGFREMQDFILYTKWHYLTFTKPFLDAMEEEVQPDFVIDCPK